MFYWLHVGVLRGEKTCRTCGPLIGRLYETSWRPPYPNPVHRNCRCVWWMTERYPTPEEEKEVIDWWTLYFERIRAWYGHGDIETTKEIMKLFATLSFGGEFISKPEEITPEPGGPTPTPTLSEFIANTFDEGDQVIIDSELLNYYLRKKIISLYWWNLSDIQRDRLSIVILDQNIINASDYADGKPNCKGVTGSWNHADCCPHAVMRWGKLGNSSNWADELRACYWRAWEGGIGGGYVTHCYGEVNFNLPVHVVSVPGHYICGIQIKSDQTSFDSWRFFQYQNTDITLGNWQMPCGEGNSIIIYDVLQVTCGGFELMKIVKWVLDANCIPILE